MASLDANSESPGPAKPGGKTPGSKWQLSRVANYRSDSVRGGKSPSGKCPRTHSTDIGESKNVVKTLKIISISVSLLAIYCRYFEQFYIYLKFFCINDTLFNHFKTQAF